MEFVSQNILLISIVVISGGGLLWQLLRGGGANEVNAGQATLLINREDALVVDVREADEFATGHPADARNIPLSKLADRANELEKFKDKPLILCCASGMRSSKACGELKQLGFTRLYSLAGGFQAWSEAGLPVKKGTRNK